MNSIDASHAVSTGLITVAVAKGWTMSQGLDVPLMPQIEGGVAAGASAIVADSLLASQSALVKAGATGVILSGAMWAWKGDRSWQVWLPVGVASYWLSDMAMKAIAKMPKPSSSGRLGADGAGQQDSPSSMPEIPNM